jgi:hypothetical protein
MERVQGLLTVERLLTMPPFEVAKKKTTSLKKGLDDLEALWEFGATRKAKRFRRVKRNFVVTNRTCTWTWCRNAGVAPGGVGVCR